MASVTEVKTTKPKVEAITLSLKNYEAMDLLAYIESYYKRNGYGYNQHKTNGIYVAIKDGLDGKVDAATPVF